MPSTSSIATKCRGRSARAEYRYLPRSARPGTGYVKLYHSMGMVTGNRGAWAYVRGAMGIDHPGAGPRRAERGVTIRDGRRGGSDLVKDGARSASPPTGGEEIDGKIVLSNADPKRTYLKVWSRSATAGRIHARHRAIKIKARS